MKPDDPSSVVRLWLITAVAFLCSALVAAALVLYFEKHRRAADRARIEVMGKTCLLAVGERLNRALSATYALAALVRQGKGHVEGFDAIAREMLSLYPEVSSLQLAPKGIVSSIVPRAGNEQAIGHDLLNDPARTKEAFLARDTRRLTLAGPFPLIQGGRGAVGYLPVFLPDGRGQEHFWGFTIVLVRFPEVLSGPHETQLRDSGLSFELWRVHHDSGGKDILASSGGPLSDPVEARLDVPDGAWILSLMPSGGWHRFSPASVWGIVLALMFSVLVSVIVNRVVRQPIALRREVKARTQELERAKAVLEESEQRWQFALEGAGDGVWDWDVRTNTVFFSRQWKAMLGYGEDEIGNNLSEWDSRLHPDDRTATYAALESYFSGESPAYVSEHRLLCKNGTYKWILDRGHIVARDEEGKPLRVIGTHTDITERKEMELAMLREKSFLEAVMDSVPGMLYVYDDQGRLVQWNRQHETMTGYSAEELSRMHLLDWYKGDEPTIAYISERVEHAMQHGFADAEANLQKKDGTTIPMYFTAVPVTISDKSYFIGIGIDISARLQAEAEKEQLARQLVQAQKMESVGRLAGGIAHDFNNMLAVIFISLDLIRMRVGATDPLLENLEQIERAATRARDITRQLLAFSRQQIIAPKVVSLNEVIAETEKTIVRLIGEDVEVLFLPCGEPARILIDPAQIDQVLINLALNARDAMPDGGKLTIETAIAEFDEAYCRTHGDALPGRYVRLSVSDEGHGMDRTTLDHIFEPFFTTKEVGKGTGLGLAMVYGVVRQNNGFVNVYSEVGRGTTFKLYFPLAEDQEQATAVSEPKEPVYGSGRILLVEDDESVRSVTAKTLETLGYEVTAAATPAEALSVVQNSDTPYALLVTDVVMPGMNGKQLSERLCALRPGMKVLFMSGYTENTIVHRGVLDAGLNFIQKPFSMQNLSRKVREILNS